MTAPPDTLSLLAEFQSRYPYRFDPFQVEAMEALGRGRSVLVAAPTGTGKTVIAEYGLFLARRSDLRALYTTPIKALSNQKFRDFRTIYGDEVGLLTGDVVIRPEASILVMTTEVLRNMLVQGLTPMLNVGAIVFDEVHYMGDVERGTAWEEAILLAPKGVPLVCLSATVPNAAEVAAWLRAAHGDLECVFHDERTIPLEHRYFLEGRAHLVVDASGRRRKWFAGVGGELANRMRRRGMDLDETHDREPRQEAEPWQVVRYLEGHELTPAIYFLFSRRACEQAAASCLALPAVPHAVELVREARARLSDLPREDRGLEQVGLLLRLLTRGVAVHHAGLLPVIKMLVEELFASGRLRAVFATDTLALGINMPARTTVVGEMTKWDGEQKRLLTPNEYRQMTGRAGRRGIDRKGVSLLLYSPWVAFERAMEVVQGELLPLESAFAPSYSTALNLWRGPEDEGRLADLYARSLRRFQHDARLEELTIEVEALEDQFKARQQDDLRDRRTWRLSRQLDRAERELELARQEATYEARTVVHGLAEVLERFGYLRGGRPTYKAPLLRKIFDTNALTLAELIAERALLGLSPGELAEVVSWFAFDRDNPIRHLAIPRPLHRLHEHVLRVHAEVQAEERRLGLSISRPLNDDFRGLALAWAEERPLGEIAERARIAEGDLVGVLQKTLDVIGQLRGATQALGESVPPRGPDRQRWREEQELLDEQLGQADGLLRRGIVEASYRWAISGPPRVDQAELDADDLAWLQLPSLEEPRRRRDQGRPPRPPGQPGGGGKRRPPRTGGKIRRPRPRA